MKFLLILALAVAIVPETRIVTANVITPCHTGPAFWCSNLSNAKLCGAVSHCIQTVWEKEEVENDTDSVCQICLDMVKQARDELESNETISNLKDVFEGSCKLIPLKPIQKECIKMADDFIPELVEALASQMNPQMVCSVAGLCNNAAIDKMLEEQKNQKPTYIGSSLSCYNCNLLSNTILEKFNKTDKDTILENILNICGEMSTFTDACNSIVLTYFNTFYDQIEAKLSSEAVCHLSGVCSFKYHSHSEQEDLTIPPVVNSTVINDDLPCELCEQLVKHLRDVLIANTTEDEFKQVLQGLCGQTKGFKTECMSLVDEYYKIIYETLVNNLDANGACFLIGICPKGNKLNMKPIAPANVKITIKKLDTPKGLTNKEIMSLTKPVNSLIASELSNQLVKNGELCTLCEYFMHFVQETLTLPVNEEKIKKQLKNICSKSMPKSLEGECDDFVEMYSDAVIALLVQEIDPRQICPMMRMCPETPTIEIEQDKPTCPLCLFAVEQAQVQIKDDKTKENAKKVLNNLCKHFPNNKLKAECVDFVNTYTAELINLLVQNLTPQDICVAIKLCDSQGFDLKSVNIEVQEKDFDIKEGDFVETPQCMLCKKVVEMVEKELIGEKTKQNIIDALRRSCAKMKKTAQGKCQKFVDKYGELIADLLMKETKPDAICKELMYCSVQKEDIAVSYETPIGGPNCAVCELIITQLEQEVKNNKTMDEIEKALQNVCHKIPNNLSDQCSKIVKQYSETILRLIVSTPPKQICQKLNLCSEKKESVEVTTEEEYKDTPPCTVCEIIMLQLEQELKNKKTKDEIKNTLLNICSKIPNKLSNKCSTIIEQYIDQIVDLLDSIPPKEICQKINLCANIDISGDILECGICQGVTFFLSSSEKNLTNSEIKDLSCESFPSKYFEKCSEIVDYYGISIINLLENGLNENEVCMEIGKCGDKEGKHSYHLVVMDNHKTKRTLVGDNECTYGPSHWCSSKEVAKKCDLLEYCEKVWKAKKED